MSTPDSSSAPRRSFWSRWPGRFLIFLFLLVGGIALGGPTVIAIVAKPKIEAAIAGQVNGRAEIESLSVGWSGAFEIKNLKVIPAGDTPVLEAPSVTGQAAIMPALGGNYQAKVEIDKPTVRLRREPDGQTNLDHLLQKSASAPPAAASTALPNLKLDVQVKGATVVFEEGAQATRLENVDLTVDLPALDQASRFETGFNVAGGGAGKLVARLTLAREGKIDPSGSIEYALDAIALDKLETAARLYSDLQKLGGTLTAKGNYTIGKLPEINGADEWTLKGLTAEGPSLGKEPLAFPEIRLKNKVAIDAKRVGKADLTLVSGKAVDLTSAVTFGEGEAVDATFKLVSDLKELGQALRGVLRMKEGVSLDGALTADGTLKGSGSKGTLKANLLVDQLAALDAAGKRTPIEKKVAMVADLAFDGEAKSADISKFTVESSPVQASAHGKVTKDSASGSYEATADLDLLSRRLASFMDLGVALAGKIEAKGDATSQGKDIHLKGRTVVTNLLIGKNGPINLESHTDAMLQLGDELSIDGAQRTTIADATISGRTVKNVVLEARFKKSGEKIDAFALTGPGLKLDASGTVARISGTLDLDPAPFYQNLGILFGEFGLGGKAIKGEFTVVSGESREITAKLEGPEMLLGGKTHKDLKVVVDATLGAVTVLRQARASTSLGFLEAKGGVAKDKTDLKVNAEGDLGSIAVLVAVPPHWQINGKATVSGSVTGAGDLYTVTLDTQVPELAITRKWRSDETSSPAGTAKPVTISSSGTIRTGDVIAVDLKHKVTVLEVVREGRTVRNLTVECTLKQTGDKVESLVVTGPGLKVDGAGPLKAFRATVDIDPKPFYKDLAFLFGEYDLDGPPMKGDVSVSVGDTWDVRGRLEGPELKASGRTYKDVRMEFDLGMAEAIVIRQFLVAATGASFSAKGTMSDKREDYEFEGEALAAKIAPDALPKDWEIPRKITFGGSITGGNDAYDASFQAAIQEIGLTTPGSDTLRGKFGPLEFVSGGKVKFGREMVMDVKGRATLKELFYAGRSVENVIIDLAAKQTGAKLDALSVTGPGLKLEGSGTASALAGKLALEPGVFYLKLGSAFGDFDLGGKPLAGTFEMKSDKTTDVKGELAGPELVIRGASHKNVKITFDVGMGDVIAIRAARASASSGWIEAKGTYADAGADLKLDGEGDLSQLGGLLGIPKDAKVGGKAVVQGSVTGKDVLKAALGLEIEQFTAQKAGKAVNDPVVSLTTELTVDRTAKKITIDKGELNSSFARGTIGGRVLSYDATPVVEDFALDLRYVPDKFGPVLGLFAPGEMFGADEQALSMKLSGKATATELKCVIAAKLDAYKYYGITLRGPVDATLEKGMLALKAPLDSNNGKIVTEAELDLHEAKDSPVSTFSSFAKNVAVNEETSILLEKVHPIFHMIESGGHLTGTAEMDVNTEWAGPLDAQADPVKAAEKALAGKGRLLVKDLTLTGSPFLGTVLQYLGDGGAGKPGEVSCENMIIGQGKVSYDLMRVFLQGVEMKFHGSVYFDQRLDMEMEVPITQKLAAKNAGMDKFMGKTMLVPIKGTVANPKIDFAGAIANILKKGLLDKAGGLFHDILGGGDDKEKK